MRAKFTRTVKIEGTTYTEGTVITQGAIDEGSFQSLLRRGWLVAV
jgi:hypothetical protein